MNLDDATRIAWAALEDHVHRWAPALDYHGLAAVAADLRTGSGGAWEDMPEDLDARRQLLLDEVAREAEQLSGRPWPIHGDLLPTAPDDAAELIDYTNRKRNQK